MTSTRSAMLFRQAREILLKEGAMALIRQAFWFVVVALIERLFGRERLLVPNFNGPIYYLAGQKVGAQSLIAIMRKKYELVVNERIVEIPFVFKHIALLRGSNILEIGCVDSYLSIALASLGYTVTGVDLRDYPYGHPRFQFIKGDFLQNLFERECFDGVVAISTIEHFGLGGYGSNFVDSEADRKAIMEIHGVLKAGGFLFLTVPYGKGGKTSGYRVYNRETLSRLLNGFNVVEKEYFIGLDRKSWTPALEESTGQVDSTERGFVQGIVCLVCEKP